MDINVWKDKQYRLQNCVDYKIITLYFQVIFLYIYLIAFKEDRAAVK